MDERTRLRLVILRNEVDSDHLPWIRACEHMADRVNHTVIDLTKDDWLLRFNEGHFDAVLTQPTGWSTAMKALYDERITRIRECHHLPMIPSVSEILIYENKRALAAWLKTNGIPHPETHVFSHATAASAFIRTAMFPLVAKTSLGAGGSGVRILRSAANAAAYVERTFNGSGAPRDVGPKWQKPGFAKRVLRKLADPAAALARLREYRALNNDVQRDHVLFQAFIPHSFEWRVVRIGDSFFAHKKLVAADKASGSLLKEYGDPPKPLLDFTRELTEAHGFRSVAVDIFEAPGGGYFVNEIQCVFGQSDQHQMIVNDLPGRYRWVNDAWLFEPGDFNRFECYLLRLEYMLDVLSAAPAQTSSTHGG